MSHQNEEVKSKVLDAYKDWNRGTAENYKQNIRTLGNQILTLSAGTLGLSLTFVSDLVDLSSALLLPLLVASWNLLAVGLLSGLFGLRYSTREATVRESLDAAKQKTGLGQYSEKGPDVSAGKARSDAITSRIELYNKLSFWLFVFGLVTMVSFISVNILS